MNNKQMIVFKDNFIRKIKSLFLTLFRKKEAYNDSIQKAFDEEKNVDIPGIFKKEKNKFENKIKVENSQANKIIEKRKFLQEIEGNVEMLNKLSIKSLKQLEEYYKNIIIENDKIIKRLQSKS